MNCPNCGNENRSDAIFCDACGTRLKGGEHTERPRPLPSAGSGRYVAQSFLGEGGRTRVYRALDTRLDREVALSLIRTAGLDEAAIERVRREAKAMAKLGDHPNIVNIFDVGEEEGAIFLIAELMPGGSVEEQLDQHGGALPVEQVLDIARDVGAALRYVHEQRIVHRDIKPANVWLARDGTWKLGDFGLAAGRYAGKLTTEGMMLGTVAYMAPEQAAGGEVDGRSDLYSFGALLYEAATGKPPFAGDDAIAIISQQINTAPVAPTWHNAAIPAPLESLILDLLAKSPSDRPQSAGEVLERLEEIGDVDASVPQPAPGRPDNQLDRLAAGVFVGREAESQQLRLLFDGARRGNGGIALLVGEPVIGKTRMSEELITTSSVRSSSAYMSERRMLLFG
jgi:serine/threonine protein kinase